MSCDDDTTISREDALAMLLSATGIQEGRGWLAAVIPAEDGKLFFHYDMIPVPLHNNPYFPFPENACKEIDKKALTTIIGSAWSKMAKMPLFSSILIPAPTLATMLTGVKSTKELDELDDGIKELDALYAKTACDMNLTCEEFYDREEGRNIVDIALMARAKRNDQLRKHKLHVPVGWERYMSSAAVFLYYSRIVDILSVTSAFTPQHAGAQWHAQQKRIDAANAILFSSIDKTLKAILADTHLSECMSRARSSVAGSRFVGFDYDIVHEHIQKACIDFTYKVISEMERWILTICGIPCELHETFMCTAQPRIPLDAGFLNEDGQRWQEDLRDIRAKAISSVWQWYCFDEEFTEEETPQFINVPHLVRREYTKNVFDVLVRMSYDDETCDKLALQRTLTTEEKLSFADMSFTYAYPCVIYYTVSGEAVDCDDVFREE